MRLLQHSIIKTVASAGLMVGLLGGVASCTTISPSYDDRPVYRGDNNNDNFNRASQKLRQDLRRSGYDVMNIQPENYRGNQALLVYAKKNNQPYILRYSYPGLRQISASKKDWSNVWKDNKRNNKSKTTYSSKNDRYKNSVQKDARYDVIRKRAISKVNGMGYQVKDIDFDEKNNRSFFEIEAKRGSQDYEITLGYPNLNVVKIEKD